MKSAITLAMLFLGMAAAEPFKIPVYTIDNKPYFDALWIAQHHRASISLEYVNNIKVNAFTIQNKTYEMAPTMDVVRVNKAPVQLSGPVLDLEHYPVVPVNDFAKLFPDLQPEWWAASSPSAVRSSAMAVVVTPTPPTAPTAASQKHLAVDLVSKKVIFNSEQWWKDYAASAGLITIKCPQFLVSNNLIQYPIGCAIGGSGVHHLRYRFLEMPQTTNTRIMLNNETDFYVTFTPIEPEKYLFRAFYQQQTRTLWVVFAKRI